jgi:esterase/lipase
MVTQAHDLCSTFRGAFNQHVYFPDTHSNSDPAALTCQCAYLLVEIAEIDVNMLSVCCHHVHRTAEHPIIVRYAITDSDNQSVEPAKVVQIIHGGQDTYVPVSSSQDFHEDSASTDKKVLVYDNGHHLLLQDSEVAGRVAEDAANWFCGHVPA